MSSELLTTSILDLITASCRRTSTQLRTFIMDSNTLVNVIARLIDFNFISGKKVMEVKQGKELILVNNVKKFFASEATCSSMKTATGRR